MLKSGSRGDGVKALQQQLKAAGFDPGPIDGIFGGKTSSAVKAFQKAKGLTVDGIVGPNTTKSLGGAAPAGKKKTTKGAVATDVRQAILDHYPSMAWAIDHPELGKILTQAGEGEWDAIKLNGAVQGSEWFKTRTQAQRQMETLKGTDKAEYDRVQSNAKATIQQLAGTLGLTLTTAQVAEVANDYLSFSLNDQQLKTSLMGYAKTNAGQFVDDVDAGTVGGSIASTTEQVRQIAQDHLLNVNDATITSWTTGIINGTKTVEAFENYSRSMATAQMPFLKQFIDQGISPAEALQPYRDILANKLEVPPAQVDWTDAKYQSVLRVREGAEDRLATTAEMSANIRQKFAGDWDKTQGAQQSAMQLTQRIAETFGKRA